MQDCTDIRAQVEADAQLQREISAALLAVADGLTSGGDLRMVRILTRTLEASWSEHVSFQGEVVFPILIARHGPDLAPDLERLDGEHKRLAELHAEISRRLEALLKPDHAIDEGIEALVRDTLACRLSHLECDSRINSRLPDAFTAAERTLCEKWSQTRPHPRFPLNLLPKGDRPFPKLGGKRLH